MSEKDKNQSNQQVTEGVIKKGGVNQRPTTPPPPLPKPQGKGKKGKASK